MIKVDYPNIFQNGKKVEVEGNHLCEWKEYTFAQLIKIGEKANKIAEDAKEEYDKSVKNLQRIDYEEFAAKCAYSYAKANMIDFTRFANVDADQMCRFKDMSLDKRIKLKKEKIKAQTLHTNYTKPYYMRARYEADRIRNTINWVWKLCEIHDAPKDSNSRWDEWRSNMEKTIIVNLFFYEHLSRFDSTPHNASYTAKINKYNVEEIF